MHPLCRDRKAAEQSDPSDHDVAARLAQLKGAPVPSAEDDKAKRGFFVQPDARSDQTKVDDLLKQMGQEVNLDSATAQDIDPTDELVKRLEKLKGKPVRRK